MENILQFCPVAPIRSGTVQLNADQNHASSLSDSHNSYHKQQCLPSLRSKPKNDHYYLFPLTSYLRSLLLKALEFIFIIHFLDPHEIKHSGTKHN